MQPRTHLWLSFWAWERPNPPQHQPAGQHLCTPLFFAFCMQLKLPKPNQTAVSGGVSQTKADSNCMIPHPGKTHDLVHTNQVHGPRLLQTLADVVVVVAPAWLKWLCPLAQVVVTLAQVPHSQQAHDSMHTNKVHVSRLL